MSETIICYPINDPKNASPMDRDDFYTEQIASVKATGKPTKSLDTIAVFLFNQRGELLVQKRAFTKSQNPGLLDKSVGGHIRYGDTPDFTVMIETVQELQSPSIVLANRTDFLKTKELLKDYLSTVAIIQHIGEEFLTLDRTIDDETVALSYHTHLYAGLYDGRIRTADQEAKGMLYYTLAELKSEMQKIPAAFTGDLHFMIEHYKTQLSSFAA